MKKKITPLKAIRLNCVQCSVNQPKEVRLCPITDCPLYPFRFGSNPNRKGIGPSGLPKCAKYVRESSRNEKNEVLHEPVKPS